MGPCIWLKEEKGPTVVSLGSCGIWIGNLGRTSFDWESYRYLHEWSCDSFGIAASADASHRHVIEVARITFQERHARTPRKSYKVCKNVLQARLASVFGASFQKGTLRSAAHYSVSENTVF